MLYYKVNIKQKSRKKFKHINIERHKINKIYMTNKYTLTNNKILLGDMIRKTFKLYSGTRI